VNAAPGRRTDDPEPLSGPGSLAEPVPSARPAAVAGVPVRRWHAELAWLPGDGVRADVLIEAAGDRFTAVTPDIPPAGLPPGTTRLPGLTLPGLANGHSHAFHRALRGRTQAGAGTFWTWREVMYQVAGRLDPDSYLALATAVYAEMALAGITCVGEFHYLHHGPAGIPYGDPNELGRILLTAAARAGLRITLLDTCYLSGGLDADGRPQPLAGPQLRFGDGDADSWAARVAALGAGDRGELSPTARAGAAIHSVRAVPPEQMASVLAWANGHGAALHAHLSEQVAENQACLAAYGRTPAQVLADAGALGPRATMVHATHLTSDDIKLIGGSRTHSCFCPTTEADLADGIGPAVALAEAGSPLTVGSDSQAVIDLFTEVQRLELDQRLASGQRGRFGAASLAQAATAAGHASLGWPEAGALAPGALADLITVSLDSVRLAGTAGEDVLATVMFAATAQDVRSVVIGGRDVVAEGRHLLVEDVPGLLAAAIRAVTN
jgi:formiminoglutamate deiminase